MKAPDRADAMAGDFEQRIVVIYRRTIDGLFAAVCLWSRGDRELTADVVQETYLRAVADWRSRGLPRTPEAWLRTVARNLLVSHYRREGRVIAMEDPPEPSVAPVDAEARLDVREGLADLGTARAHLLHAYHLEGKSVAEIARAERVSERAVEGRLRRARRALARLLRPDSEEMKA